MLFEKAGDSMAVLGPLGVSHSVAARRDVALYRITVLVERRRDLQGEVTSQRPGASVEAQPVGERTCLELA